MTSRRRGHRNGNLVNAMYIGIGGFLILIVAGIILTLLWMKPEKIVRNPLTLCPVKNGPSAFTTILIDRTDNFGSISKADVEVQLHDILNETKENELVSLYVVKPVEKAPLQSLITICNPGNPDEADPWVESPYIVDKNWKSKFKAPLDALLVQLLDEEKASLSPIMESIQSISVSALGGKRKSSLPRKIILISDLLQNSQTWSLYSQEPDFDAFSQADQTRGLNPDLRGVTIEIFFLQRETRRPVDENQLLRFWVRWIGHYGGRVTRILKVSGINK